MKHAAPPPPHRRRHRWRPPSAAWTGPPIPPPHLLHPHAAPTAAGTEPPPRFKGPMDGGMTPEQQAIHDEIARTRTTGIRGPFGPWLACPSVARPAQELGRVCRYETSLALRESELAILLTARCPSRELNHLLPSDDFLPILRSLTRFIFSFPSGHARDHGPSTEWDIHVHEARGAGLEEGVIAALERGEPPAPWFPPATAARDAAIYAFAAELLKHSTVSDERYAAAVAALGEAGVVELTSIVGYYGYVAYTLNVFEIEA